MSFDPPAGFGVPAPIGVPVVVPGAPPPPPPPPAPPAPPASSQPAPPLTPPAPVGVPTLPSLPSVPSVSTQGTPAGPELQQDTAAPQTVADGNGLAPLERAPGVDATAEPPEMKPLIGTSIYRHLFFLCVIGGAALAFASPLLAMIPQAMALLLLVVWSVLATTNARRAKPKTSYNDAPSPWRSGFWWFGIVIIGLPVLVAAGFVQRWADGLPYDQQDMGAFAVVAAVIVAIIVMLACWYRPYAYLAKVATWVSGDADAFRRWFWRPIMCGFVSYVLVLIAAGIMTSDSATNSSGVPNGPSAYAGTAVLLVAVLLPTAAWFFLGNRAMSGLEASTRMTWERRADPDGGFDPEQLAERLALAQQYAAQQPGR